MREENGNVILEVQLEQNPEINKAIDGLVDQLVRCGVPKRSAYGNGDDLRDNLLRDAVAGLISVA